jgi:hypothetical protein
MRGRDTHLHYHQKFEYLFLPMMGSTGDFVTLELMDCGAYTVIIEGRLLVLCQQSITGGLDLGKGFVRRSVVLCGCSETETLLFGIMASSMA